MRLWITKWTFKPGLIFFWSGPIRTQLWLRTERTSKQKCRPSQWLRQRERGNNFYPENVSWYSGVASFSHQGGKTFFLISLKPVRERINFKVCTIIFQCINGSAPSYLQNDIQRYTTSSSIHKLRSAADTTRLHIPFA